MNWPAGARMTIPGNAEWALWFFVEILFAIIWAVERPGRRERVRHRDGDHHVRLPDLARDREGLARARAVAALREPGAGPRAAGSRAREPRRGAAV